MLIENMTKTLNETKGHLIIRNIICDENVITVNLTVSSNKPLKQKWKKHKENNRCHKRDSYLSIHGI